METMIQQYKILKEQSEVIRQQIVKMNEAIMNLQKTKQDIENQYNEMLATIKKFENDNPAVIFS